MIVLDRPQRKHPRLKQYDYSLQGMYYVTIHLEDGAPLLSHIDSTDHVIRLTKLGKIAWKHLHALCDRFGHVRIDKYVIMPTHIHAIIEFRGELPEGQARASLMDVVGTYKSLVTRAYNGMMDTPGRKIFQTSFYETVLRTDAAYLECWRYIDENPLKWALAPEDR